MIKLKKVIWIILGILAAIFLFYQGVLWLALIITGIMILSRKVWKSHRAKTEGNDGTQT